MLLFRKAVAGELGLFKAVVVCLATNSLLMEALHPLMVSKIFGRGREGDDGFIQV